MNVEVIAHIYTDFPEKFGVPRQSGIVEELTGVIRFEPKYRNPEAVKGMDGYDYLWLLWEFQVEKPNGWSATVKPPRLGGNTHMGVFATRSPFRPNSIGLSSVRLKEIRFTEQGPELLVGGADLRNETPIFDIKPYLPFTDAHPDARDGFAGEQFDKHLRVEFPEALLSKLPREKREAAVGILMQDPRPAYHKDAERPYGISFAGWDIRFRVKEDLLTVFDMVPLKNGQVEQKVYEKRSASEK